METYDFTLILDLNDHDLTDEILDEFYEAGLDDALIGETAGVVFADLSREADDALDAVLRAIKQVEDAPLGAKVIRTEPDEIVTIADIAKRLNRTDESIRLLITGQRGPGRFPAPTTRISSRRSRVWRWSDVVSWFSKYEDSREISRMAEYSSKLALVNDLLRSREHLQNEDPRVREAREALTRRTMCALRGSRL
jgi:hypothetical protein